MTPGLRRKLWLFGLTLMIAHMVVLVAAAIGMWGGDPTDTDWKNLPSTTAIALRIARPGSWFLALNAALDVAVIIAYCMVDRRKATRVFFACLVVRLLFVLLSVIAIVHLASLGRVQLRSGAFRSTWTTFAFSDALNEVAGHVLLSVPLVIFALRWTPLLWPASRRRLSRERQGHCLACGYDLQATINERCPECGIVRTTVPKP